MIRYLQIKQKKLICTQWFAHFRDLLRSNTHQIDSDRQKTLINLIIMKNPLNMVT